MRTILINSPDLEEMIFEIASAIGGKVARKWKEYCCIIPEDWGKGTISAHQLKDGIRLIRYDCRFHENVQLLFKDRSEYPLSMSYCLMGEYGSRFDSMDELIVVEQYQSLIIVNHVEEDFILEFKKDSETKARYIDINRKLFRQEFDLADYSVEPHYNDLFKNGIDEPFYHNHMYSVILSRLFDQIDAIEIEGLVKSLLVHGLVFQIVGEQLTLYDDDLKDDGVQGKLRQYEVECIHHAARIIEEEMEDSRSIQQLAHRVGINVNKLQDGFKILYHTTVNGHVQETRMKKATSLLHYSDYSISEIVEKLGLNSKSYFSKIFKEEYGITPSGYRKNKQNSLTSQILVE